MDCGRTTKRPLIFFSGRPTLDFPAPSARSDHSTRWVCNGLKTDTEKGVALLQDAVNRGDASALQILGLIALVTGDSDGAVKLTRTAAASGDDRSVKTLWDFFRKGYLSKDHLEESLRANQEAMEDMKSDERDRHAKWLTWKKKQEEEASAKKNGS